MRTAPLILLTGLVAGLLGPAWPGPLPAQEGALGPAGTWHTISDVDGRPRGIVALTVTDGVLSGRIAGSLVPGEPPGKRCTACTGALKDQPLQGMEILSGLRWDGEAWTGGWILDPDTGRRYRATIRLADDGRSLTLRGYVGVALLGRTQRWVRAP